jgi:hypothetical protein
METLKSSYHFLFKLFVVLAVMLLFSLHIFPYVFGNGSGQVFSEGDGERTVVGTGNVVIESLVVDGAGYFINANSVIQAILNRFELSDKNGVDFTELNELIDCASFNMQNALEVYQGLLQEASSTPYNPTIVEKLSSFDFASFLIENNLNESTYNKAKSYLCRSDITGIYKEISKNFVIISSILNSIRAETAQNRLPKLQSFWKLNDITIQTLAFGQYVSQICYAIK